MFQTRSGLVRAFRIDLTGIEDSDSEEDQSEGVLDSQRHQITPGETIDKSSGEAADAENPNPSPNSAASVDQVKAFNDGHVTVSSDSSQEGCSISHGLKSSSTTSTPVKNIRCRPVIPSVSPQTVESARIPNEDKNDEKEVEITQESNVGENPLLDFPHRREDCQRFDFASKPEKFCRLCYCYICDIPSSKCLEWTAQHEPHCRAKHADKKSRLKRKSIQMRKGTLRPRKRPRITQRFAINGDSGNRKPLSMSRAQSPLPRTEARGRSLRNRKGLLAPLRLRSKEYILSGATGSDATEQSTSTKVKSSRPKATEKSFCHDLFLPGKAKVPSPVSAPTNTTTTPSLEPLGKRNKSIVHRASVRSLLKPSPSRPAVIRSIQRTARKDKASRFSANKAKSIADDLLQKAIAMIKELPQKHLPRMKTKKVTITIRCPRNKKAGDDIKFSNPRIPDQDLWTKIPKNCAPGGKFVIQIPLKQRSRRKKTGKDTNDLPMEMLRLFDEFGKAYDEWCRKQSLLDNSFQLAKHKREKFVKLLEQFPKNLITPITLDYLKQEVSRFRKKMYDHERNSATAAVLKVQRETTRLQTIVRKKARKLSTSKPPKLKISIRKVDWIAVASKKSLSSISDRKEPESSFGSTSHPPSLTSHLKTAKRSAQNSHFTRSADPTKKVEPNLHGTLGAYWLGQPTKYAGVPYQKRTSDVIHSVDTSYDRRAMIISTTQVQETCARSYSKRKNNSFLLLGRKESTRSKVFECRNCGKQFHPRGIKNHERTCLPVYTPRPKASEITVESKAPRPKLMSESPQKKLEPTTYKCRNCGKRIHFRGIKNHEKSCLPVYTPRPKMGQAWSDISPQKELKPKNTVMSLCGTISYDADSRRYSILGTWNCPESKSFPPQKFCLMRTLRDGEKDPNDYEASISGIFDGHYVAKTMSLDSEESPIYHDRLVITRNVNLEFTSGKGDGKSGTKFLEVYGSGTNKYGAFSIHGTAKPCANTSKNVANANLYTVTLHKRNLQKSAIKKAKKPTSCSQKVAPRKTGRSTRSRCTFSKGTIIRKQFDDGIHYEGEVVGYNSEHKYLIRYTNGYKEHFGEAAMSKYYKHLQKYSHESYSAKARKSLQSKNKCIEYDGTGDADGDRIDRII